MPRKPVTFNSEPLSSAAERLLSSFVFANWIGIYSNSNARTILNEFL